MGLCRGLSPTTRLSLLSLSLSAVFCSLYIALLGPSGVAPVTPCATLSQFCLFAYCAAVL